MSIKTEAGETIQSKSFHTITLWGPVAEVAGQFIRPGSQLFIGGRLQTDSWEDEKTGEKRSKTKVVGNEMILLDPKAGQTPAPTNESVAGGVNRAEVVGNVTKDPEMRTTTSGQKVLTIGIATNDRWKDKATGEMKEKSEFHNVVVWGALAEAVAMNAKKGARVYASGRVQSRSWETPTGQKRTSTEIVADQVSVLGVKNKVAEESQRLDGDASFRQSSPSNDSAFAQDTAAPLPAIPNIEYKSAVSVEDLPF
jgi:single-strand DNA-binding protein